MGELEIREEVEVGERKAAQVITVGQVSGKPALLEVKKRGVLASFCVSLK